MQAANARREYTEGSVVQIIARGNSDAGDSGAGDSGAGDSGGGYAQAEPAHHPSQCCLQPL